MSSNLYSLSGFSLNQTFSFLNTNLLGSASKLELFAKSGIENEYYLEDNLRCETTSSITLNNATLFWHYKNVRKNVSDTVTHGSDNIIFDEGYWTFDMIQDKLRDNKIALKHNTYDNTCKIYSDKTLNLKSFGLLLGFSSSLTVLPKVENKFERCRR